LIKIALMSRFALGHQDQEKDLNLHACIVSAISRITSVRGTFVNKLSTSKLTQKLFDVKLCSFKSSIKFFVELIE